MTPKSSSETLAASATEDAKPASTAGLLNAASQQPKASGKNNPMAPYDYDSYQGQLYRVFEGTVLEGVVTNHIDGGLTGPILIMLTTDYYSHDHQQLLMPQGTRLIGTVQSVGNAQQRKIFVTFHRAVCPDGFSLELDKYVGLDPIGTTGLATKVDHGYHDAKQAGTVTALTGKLAAHAAEIFQLIDSVYSKELLPEIEDGRKGQPNPLNANFHKKAFRELWSRIHQKAIYSVQFETAELIAKCIQTLDAELKVAPLQYVVQRGEQAADTTYEALKAGEAFQLEQTQTAQLKSSVHSEVKYDLIGKLAEETKLKHIYFIAETKGSLSSMELREIEKSKIECARKFFTKITSDHVKYDVVTSYSKLMELVQ